MVMESELAKNSFPNRTLNLKFQSRMCKSGAYVHWCICLTFMWNYFVVHGLQIKYYNKRMSWVNATKFCQDHNGTLAEITNLKKRNVSIFTECVPHDTAIWSGEYKSLTPYWISEKGCFIMNVSQEIKANKKGCHDECQESIFGILNDDECICNIIIDQTREISYNKCLSQNSNHSQSSVVMVNVFEKVNVLENSQDCVAATCGGTFRRNPQYQSFNCSNTRDIVGYCHNTSGSVVLEENNMSQLKAREYCGNRSLFLSGTSLCEKYSMQSNTTLFWTNLNRKLSLKAVGEDLRKDSPFLQSCSFIKKSGSTQWSSDFTDCFSITHVQGFICVTDTEDTSVRCDSLIKEMTSSDFSKSVTMVSVPEIFGSTNIIEVDIKEKTTILSKKVIYACVSAGGALFIFAVASVVLLLKPKCLGETNKTSECARQDRNANPSFEEQIRDVKDTSPLSSAKDNDNVYVEHLDGVYDELNKTREKLVKEKPTENIYDTSNLEDTMYSETRRNVEILSANEYGTYGVKVHEEAYGRLDRGQERPANDPEYDHVQQREQMDNV